jgi:Putative DNA-binding domain
MKQLADIEEAFTSALLNAREPIPMRIRGATRRRAERRFAVYRNNVITSLIRALNNQFPVVCRLVGHEFFQAMARAYATTHPPVSPIMMFYGETFPNFIDGFAPANAVPYLGDVARIEIARIRAYHAADAVPIGPRAFAELVSDKLGNLEVDLHPSVSVIESPYPIASIWKVNNDPARATPIAPWASEAALVARPFMEVEVHRLPPGTAAFLSSLANGGTMIDAIEAGAAVNSAFETVESLALLITSNVVTGIRGRAIG